MLSDNTKKDSFSTLSQTVLSVLNSTDNLYQVVKLKDSTTADSSSSTTKSILDDSYDIKTRNAALWNLDGSVLSRLSVSDLNKIATDIYQDSDSSYSTLDKESVVTDTTNSELNQDVLKALDDAETSLDSAISSLFKTIDKFNQGAASSINTYAKYISTKTALGSALKGIVQVIAQNMTNYQNGVEETSFGAYMRESWVGNQAKSFLDYFAAQATGARKINILNSTPLDPGTSRSSLYGSLMLGCPFLFNSIADPDNRVLINSLIKDARYLSLTPGMPKYNGSQYLQGDANNIYKQTPEPNMMLSYLTRNGIDENFSSKDKRYYTFETKYEEYFSYLEAMLNPIWIKMGLAADATTANKFNLFSFFNIKNNSSIVPSGSESLMDKYKSSLGFYINPSSAVAESVSNSTTGTGSELASRANDASDTYQKINYITGMGTGGSARNTSRISALGLTSASSLGDYFSSKFTTANSILKVGDKSNSAIVKALSVVAAGTIGVGIDTFRLSSTEDFGSVIQSFAVTNGMKVVYPELWNNSTYTRSINFSITFMSPYGDPLSIFKYVYVPFCALLCFGLPRQAAENGYVSPFFVRADIPGLFTSDLALITDITWTKGGAANLWTKDGLPRAIDVSFSVSDLYPYLAMTKRMSFLSANPSYTVFLDNMAGMLTSTDKDDSDAINDYFKELINRVNGTERNGNNLWNKFNKPKQSANAQVGNTFRSGMSSNANYLSVPWVHNSSIN